MADPVVFQKLQRWQDSEDGQTDAELAKALGVNHTTIWRAKRGLRVLGMPHQIALQKITGIAPSEWADFYAQTVHLRPSKGEAAGRKKAGRPFARSEVEAA